MQDLLTLAEAAEVSGWSMGRILGHAMRPRAPLRVFVLPDEGGWLAELFECPAVETEPRWRQAAPEPLRLTEPIRLPSDVLSQQVAVEGRVRFVPLDGRPIDYPRERLAYPSWELEVGEDLRVDEVSARPAAAVRQALFLRPARRVGPSTLHVLRTEWEALLRGGGDVQSVEGRKAALETRLDKAEFSLSPPRAAELLGLHPKALRRRIEAARQRPDLPRVWRMEEGRRGGRRYHLAEDPEALRLWLELLRQPPPAPEVKSEPTAVAEPAEPGPSVASGPRGRRGAARESIRERARRARRR